MTGEIKLYELGPTRSSRCRWTLLELDMPFESVDGRELIGRPEYRKVHPLGVFPALEVDGRVLFESAAICTWLGDQAPEKGLIATPGSWERGLHDQWVCFALNEMEAYLWSTARQRLKYAEDERVMAIVPQNDAQFRTAAAVLDDALSATDYLIDGRFSVTDIIVGFTVNWGRNIGLLGDFANLNAYLERLHARPHCALRKPSPAST